MALHLLLRVHIPWLFVLVLLQCLFVLSMTPARMLELREEARSNFRHGWENYMHQAFPQDEAYISSLTLHPVTSFIQGGIQKLTV